MNRQLMIGILVFFALAAPARLGAHAGHSHTIMGTVVSRDGTAVNVETPSGEVLVIAITRDTAVVRGKLKAGIAEVNKGVRVVVDIGDGEDPLIAHEIRLGATAVVKK